MDYSSQEVPCREGVFPACTVRQRLFLGSLAAPGCGGWREEGALRLWCLCEVITVKPQTVPVCPDKHCFLFCFLSSFTAIHNFSNLQHVFPLPFSQLKSLFLTSPRKLKQSEENLPDSHAYLPTYICAHIRCFLQKGTTHYLKLVSPLGH